MELIFMEGNTGATKAFQYLKAEQQEKIVTYKPQLMKSILRNMSYREWRQYKCKQRSDRCANSYAKNKK